MVDPTAGLVISYDLAPAPARRSSSVVQGQSATSEVGRREDMSWLPRIWRSRMRREAHRAARQNNETARMPTPASARPLSTTRVPVVFSAASRFDRTLSPRRRRVSRDCGSEGVYTVARPLRSFSGKGRERHEQHHLLDRAGRSGRGDSRVLRLALRTRSLARFGPVHGAKTVGAGFRLGPPAY
jgi:hypothetical protein